MRHHLQPLLGKRVRLTGEIKCVRYSGPRQKHHATPKNQKFQVTLTNVQIPESPQPIDHMNLFIPFGSTPQETINLLKEARKKKLILTCTGEVRRYFRRQNEQSIITYDYGVDYLKKIDIYSKEKETHTP